MRVVLAGSSGFLGSHLRRRLTADGHELVQLVRRAPIHAGQRQWWPERGELPDDALDGADAVINLAGRGVEDRRWTPAFRQELVDSRVDPTTTLATAIASRPAAQRPAVLLNASAIGVYGDTADAEVDESAPAGSGFFPDLCQRWEAAAEPARAAGVRVACLRTGLVLDGHGGLLRPLLLTTRLLVGGPLAGGRQWMSWISMRDWTAAAAFLLTGSVDGPVNLVGPAPVRNRDFAAALGRAVHRPALLPTPKLALRIVLGEFADDAVASQRVLPRVLLQAGFAFTDRDVAAGLASALGSELNRCLSSAGPRSRL